MDSFNFKMNFKKANLQSQHRRIDIFLLSITGLLVAFGLLMVYDASVIQGLKDFKDSYYYIRQQLIWAAIGIASLAFFSFFDYKRFRFLAVPLLFVSIIMLLAVFVPFLGVAGGGAHRWLKIGGIAIQPAEIIKLTGVIFLAAVFETKVRLLPLVILAIGVTVIMAVLQRDLGSTVVFVATSATIYFASGGSLWYLLAAIPVGGLALLILILTSGYRSKRVLAFLDPFSDTQGFTYHISQVLIALGSGGLFG